MALNSVSSDISSSVINTTTALDLKERFARSIVPRIFLLKREIVLHT